jgi:hypothetical protein
MTLNRAILLIPIATDLGKTVTCVFGLSSCANQHSHLIGHGDVSVEVAASDDSIVFIPLARGRERTTYSFSLLTAHG